MSTERAPSLEDLLRAEISCSGTTHTIAMDHGHVSLTDHDAAGLERERILRAMGAPPIVRERALLAWREGDVANLPPAWEELRYSLQVAIDENDSELLRRLLDAGVDLDTRNQGGRPLLHLLHRFDPEVAIRALDASPDLEARDREGRSALRAAIEHGAVDLMEELCRRGAD